MSPGPPIPHPGTSDRSPTSLLKHECPSRQSSSSSQSPEHAPRAITATVAPVGEESCLHCHCCHHRCYRHRPSATDRNSSPHRVCPPSLPCRIPGTRDASPLSLLKHINPTSNRSRRPSPPCTLRTALTGSMRPARGIATVPPPPPAAARARPRGGWKSPPLPR